MSRPEPDLVLLHRGRPVVIVEAKGRPISSAFRDAILEQVRSYARELNSEWTILIDPDTARIYRGVVLDRPAAEIPTHEILASADLGTISTVGEAVIVLGVQRWLERLSEGEDAAQVALPEAFVRAVETVDEHTSIFTRA